jgi:hypothetical protein
MTDNLVVLQGGGTPVESDVQKLYDSLKETIYNTSEEGNLTLSSAIGILEILKLDLLSEQSMAVQD